MTSSAFLSSSPVPRIDLYVLRRDSFDGLSLLLQDKDGQPLNLTNVQICSSVWKVTPSGTFSQVMSVNVEKQEPYSTGQIRLWLTSSQTASIWDAASGETSASRSFFPTAYSEQASVAGVSPLLWDVRIEQQDYSADLVSVANGVFISQTNHGLGATERVIFNSTTSSNINYDGTSGRIYSNLTNISYAPPYSFTIASLSGVTNAAPGGSVYRLKQDTVIAGAVVVGATVSNCFP